MVSLIAEAGVDHEGSPERMTQLLDIAADACADIFKTQYYKEGTKGPNRVLPWFSPDILQTVKVAAERRNMIFCCTAHDIWSLDILYRMNIPCIKLGSGYKECPNLLDAAIETKTPLIVSTGMHVEREIKTLMERLRPEDDVIMYCISEYPCPTSHIDLHYFCSLADTWPMPGYSDHTDTLHMPLLLAAFGAKFIEKHICIEKYVKGRQDTYCAASRDEFIELSNMLSDYRKASYQKHTNGRTLWPKERKTLKWIRERYNEDDLTSV